MITEVASSVHSSGHEDSNELVVSDHFKMLSDFLDKTFDGGDPTVRTWFLVRQTFLPFLLCAVYMIVVTCVGPALMRHRQPFNMRIPMIIYNFTLVALYIIIIFRALYLLPQLDFQVFCKGGYIKKGHITYELATCAWSLYLIKYVEFTDSLFFILRKKEKHITLLHIVHHGVVPIIGWIFLRTERSGSPSIPVVLNSIIHVFLSLYFGLSAIGPSMKKYLWWKKYLVIMQMGHFVIILIFVTIIVPLMGCSIGSPWTNVAVCAVLLILFYGYYRHKFSTQKDIKMKKS